MNKGVLAIGVVVASPLLAILVLNLDRRPLEISSPLIQKKAPDVVLQTLESGQPLQFSPGSQTPLLLQWMQPDVLNPAQPEAHARVPRSKPCV